MNQIPMNQNDSKGRVTIQDRTFCFSKDLLTFISRIKPSLVTQPILSQLIRSGTSIGANCCEADESSSKKDFVNKINIAKKEAKETKYWLKLLAYLLPDYKSEAERLHQEAHELNLILAAIVRNSKI